jgi:hypothetical protein
MVILFSGCEKEEQNGIAKIDKSNQQYYNELHERVNKICEEFDPTEKALFKLSGWISPDDLKFSNLIKELDTPQKISDYMVNNFTYKASAFYAFSPYTLWVIKNGDCNDFATFGVFMADCNGYTTYQILVSYEHSDGSHCIAVYKEGDKLSFTENQYYFNNDGHFFNTFKEIINFECKLLDLKLEVYIVYDYENNIIEYNFKGENMPVK